MGKGATWVQQLSVQRSSTWSTNCSTKSCLTSDDFTWSSQSSNVALFFHPHRAEDETSVLAFLFFSSSPLFLFFLKRNYMAPETYQLSWRRGRTLLKHWIETLKLWHSIKKVTASKSSGCSSVQLGLISFFAPFFFYYLCVNKYTYIIFSSKCSTW